MGNMRPQPRILLIWRIYMAGAMCVPAFLNSVLFRVGSTIWIWGAVIWALLFLLLYFAYLPLRFRRLSYSITGERILLYSGVFYSKTQSAPLAGIQFTYLAAGPVERMLGLCALVLVFAGGRLSLPGLRRQDAESLALALGAKP